MIFKDSNFQSLLRLTISGFYRYQNKYKTRTCELEEMKKMDGKIKIRKKISSSRLRGLFHHAEKLSAIFAQTHVDLIELESNS